MLDFDKTYGCSNFTENSLEAVRFAVASASEFGHTYVGTEHILLGLVHDDSSAAMDILRRFAVTYSGVYSRKNQSDYRNVHSRSKALHTAC